MTQADPILHDYDRKARDLELEIAMSTSDLELNKAISTICQSPEWEKATERLREIRDGIVGTIVSKRLDAYELGRYQGYLRAMGILLSQRPLEDEEVDRRLQHISIQREELTALRNILS